MHAPYKHFPATEVQLIPPVWPLARWGLNIMGPLLKSRGNYAYRVVAVEYFNKWIEAKPIKNITSASIQKFFWQNIVCCFGVPRELTVDNGKQFDSTGFRALSHQLGTALCFTSVYHPQSNGAVERANDIIFCGVKKNITDLPSSSWVDELPRVIWSHNTTPSRATNFSPFKLLYGKETVTPEEIKLGSLRTQNPITEDNHEIHITVDTSEILRQNAVDNLDAYQEETRKWRNKKVKPRGIQTGDFVLRRVLIGRLSNKLRPKWEGPFLASESTLPSAFKLQTLTGEEDPYSWNEESLQKYFL